MHVCVSYMINRDTDWQLSIKVIKSKISSLHSPIHEQLLFLTAGRSQILHTTIYFFFSNQSGTEWHEKKWKS